MTETDTKYGCPGLLECLCQVVNSRRECGWVTRTVGDEKTIIVFSSECGEIVIPGNNKNFYTTSEQATKLVELETDVQAENAKSAAGGVLESNVLGRSEKSRFAN
jgi:hypothetical protein